MITKTGNCNIGKTCKPYTTTTTAGCCSGQVRSDAVLHCNCFLIHLHIIVRTASLAANIVVIIHLRRYPAFLHAVQLLHRWHPRSKPWKLIRWHHINTKLTNRWESFEDWISMKVGHAVFWTWNKTELSSYHAWQPTLNEHWTLLQLKSWIYEYNTLRFVAIVSLHWLRVLERTAYKIIVLTYKDLQGYLGPLFCKLFHLVLISFDYKSLNKHTHTVLTAIFPATPGLGGARLIVTGVKASLRRDTLPLTEPTVLKQCTINGRQFLQVRGNIQKGHTYQETYKQTRAKKQDHIWRYRPSRDMQIMPIYDIIWWVGLHLYYEYSDYIGDVDNYFKITRYKYTYFHDSMDTVLLVTLLSLYSNIMEYNSKIYHHHQHHQGPHKSYLQGTAYWWLLEAAQVLPILTEEYSDVQHVVSHLLPLSESALIEDSSANKYLL